MRSSHTTVFSHLFFLQAMNREKQKARTRMFLEGRIIAMCPFTKTEEKWAHRKFYTYMKY